MNRRAFFSSLVAPAATRPAMNSFGFLQRGEQSSKNWFTMEPSDHPQYVVTLSMDHEVAKQLVDELMMVDGEMCRRLRLVLG